MIGAGQPSLKGREKLAPLPPPLRLMSSILVGETISGLGFRSFEETRGAVHAIRRSIRSSFPVSALREKFVLVGFGWQIINIEVSPFMRILTDGYLRNFCIS